MQFTNQQFCYWLQGYFEITPNPTLTKNQIQQIEKKLTSITEPLGIYTEWLYKIIQAIAANEYHDRFIQLFYPSIRRELNGIFAHVIDNSYDTKHSSDYLQAVHDGERLGKAEALNDK
jgi:hypothetical protein